MDSDTLPLKIKAINIQALDSDELKRSPGAAGDAAETESIGDYDMRLSEVPSELEFDDLAGLKPSTPAPALTGEELDKALLKQIEFYFSDVNLPTDRFMLKKLNADGQVKISVIAGFKRVKKLSSDVQVIANALRKSSFLKVTDDGAYVGRTTPIPEVDEADIISRSVVVQNLPPHPSIDGLTTQFSQCGNVRLVRIFQPGKKSNYATQESKEIAQRGVYAVIEYDTQEAAQRAVQELTDNDNWRNGLRVTLKSAMNADKAKQQPQQAQKKKGQRGKDRGNSETDFSVTPRSSVSSVKREGEEEEEGWMDSRLRRGGKGVRSSSFDVPDTEQSPSATRRRIKAGSVDMTAGAEERSKLRLPRNGEGEEGGDSSSRRMKGVVHASNKDCGFIRPKHGKMKGTIFFAMSDVMSGETLRVGDDVEYDVDTSKDTGERKAVRVKKVAKSDATQAEEGSKAPPRLRLRLNSGSSEPASSPASSRVSRSPRTSPSSIRTSPIGSRPSPSSARGGDKEGHFDRYKMAKGPDGTKGFPSNRARPPAGRPSSPVSPGTPVISLTVRTQV